MKDTDWSKVDDDELDDAVADGDYGAMAEAGLRQAHKLSDIRTRISTLEADHADAMAALLQFTGKIGSDLAGIVAAFDAFWHQVNGAGSPSMAVYSQMMAATAQAKAGLAGFEAFKARLNAPFTPELPKER